MKVLCMIILNEAPNADLYFSGKITAAHKVSENWDLLVKMRRLYVNCANDTSQVADSERVKAYAYNHPKQRNPSLVHGVDRHIPVSNGG